ncbi:hypothetical protein [Streptomyces nanshensis]|uniref:Phorbol-ester/DAG-type domain-containing protein n=1 Tax=Streptomyces nanshensis TaxID=518642 RepID=A0A1E7LCG7_9ACTN|nr:hypothetical protein [Streptomyces nanshensis]OEV13801.1 hypothetical protein AN218_01840 [Streptomyces nanshensis]
MAFPRACGSCGQDSAFERRVTCRRCGDPVHADCRDITRTCYACRWFQAREGGVEGDMLTPRSAGRAPFAQNVPVTVAKGRPLPDLASEENPWGRSANEVRVLTNAVWAGWHIAERKEVHGEVLLKKHRRGRLRLTFSVHGRILDASTQRHGVERTAEGVTAYLEKR